MKDNLIITFDIDIKVKILLNNNNIGESGYKDTFKTTLVEDGLLTIKHGMKKANIRVLKKQINNILVTYSNSGQLKATFTNSNVDTKKREKNIISQNKTYENKYTNNKKDEVTVISNESQGLNIGTIMIISGIILLIIGFVTIFSVVPIYNSFPFLSKFYPIISVICPFLGAILIGSGINLKKLYAIRQSMIGVEFVGKNIKEIESLIGEHTAVEITNNGERIYRWEEYLELLFDKNNVCLEVLKNSIMKD